MSRRVPTNTRKCTTLKNPVCFSVSADLPGSAEKNCDQIFDVSNWTGFQGYGPLPGIKDVVKVSPDEGKIGTRFEVTNSDGSHHVETVVEYESGKLLRLRMDSFSPPLSKLADHFIETWSFSGKGSNTQVARSFELYPKNTAGRIALSMISYFFQKAVQKHLVSMQESFDQE